MTKDVIDKFIKTNTQIEGVYAELTILAKKSPDSPLNKFKVQLINRIIISANEILGTDNLPFPDFIGFDEVELPSNSDAVLVVGQYLNCLEELRAQNIVEDDYHEGEWFWSVDNKQSDIRTAQPKKLRK